MTGTTINIFIIILTVISVLLLVGDLFIKRKLYYEIKRTDKKTGVELNNTFDKERVKSVDSLRKVSINRVAHSIGNYSDFDLRERKRLIKNWAQRTKTIHRKKRFPQKVIVEGEKIEVFVIDICTEEKAERRIRDLAESGRLDSLSELYLQEALKKKSIKDYTTIMNNLVEAQRNSPSQKAVNAISRLVEICGSTMNGFTQSS